MPSPTAVPHPSPPLTSAKVEVSPAWSRGCPSHHPSAPLLECHPALHTRAHRSPHPFPPAHCSQACNHPLHSLGTSKGYEGLLIKLTLRQAFVFLSLWSLTAGQEQKWPRMCGKVFTLIPRICRSWGYCLPRPNQDGQEQANGHTILHQGSPHPRTTLLLKGPLSPDGGCSDACIPRSLGLPVLSTPQSWPQSFHPLPSHTQLPLLLPPPYLHCLACTLPQTLPGKDGNTFSSVRSSVLSLQLEHPASLGRKLPWAPPAPKRPVESCFFPLKTVNCKPDSVNCLRFPFSPLPQLCPTLKALFKGSQQDSGVFLLGHPDPAGRPHWDDQDMTSTPNLLL